MGHFLACFANVYIDGLVQERRNSIANALDLRLSSQIARFMGPTWGPSGSCRPQVGPMLAPWTLLSGLALTHRYEGQLLTNMMRKLTNCNLHIDRNLACISISTWLRHQMETFSALLALCAGNSPAIDEFPSQRPVARSFDVFFYLRLNKRLSKQSRRRWFETPLGSLWRHCNESLVIALWLVSILKQ